MLVVPVPLLLVVVKPVPTTVEVLCKLLILKVLTVLLLHAVLPVLKVPKNAKSERLTKPIADSHRLRRRKRTQKKRIDRQNS